MTDQQTPEPGESVNRESHPNAAGPDGLAGDLGISSERIGDVEGLQGTGTMDSALGRTDGEDVTLPDADDVDVDDRPGMTPKEDVDKPDERSRASGVDRTVGEVQPDPVRNKHEFDPKRNPGH